MGSNGIGDAHEGDKANELAVRGLPISICGVRLLCPGMLMQSPRCAEDELLRRPGALGGLWHWGGVIGLKGRGVGMWGEA